MSLMKEREKISPEGAALGEALRKLREARGLRVVDLAEILELTEASAKKIQRGVGLERIVRFGRLCHQLGVTPNELLGFSSGGNDEHLRGVLERVFQEVGLQTAISDILVGLVLEVLKAPPIRSVELPPREMGRIQAEIALHQSGVLKRP